MRVALLAILLLAAVPSALAQVPGVPVTACGPISIPAQPTTPAAVRAGDSTSVVVEVQNAGRLPVTVTIVAANPPSGWTIDAPGPTQVQPQATGSFTFTVTATKDAGDDAPLSFSASGTCDSPLGANCGAACNAGSANAQVTVPYAAPQGFRIPGLDNLNFPVEYLLAAIVLVGLASAIPFVMRRKKGGIVAECPEPLKMVKPGRGTSFPIELRNAAKDPAVAQFEVGAVPEGWSAFMPLPEVQLAGREARSLWLMVRSPATASTGDVVDVELKLKDPRGNDAGAVRVRAEVQGAGDA
ncbi:MAG TPA: hypothetical protein VM370_08225 [Candidatus Thermoplasmatota archaeon]|nr:hypothetical protein [Candidatus Thermoplasmatota archaeon]